MKRYLPSIRTGARAQPDRSREQFTRDLTREAEKLLSSLSRQFLQDLNTQTTQLLQGLGRTAASGSTGSGAASANPLDSIFGTVGQVLASGITYLINKPQTSTSTAESLRSQQADSSFRLSQSQAMAEANAKISKGNKSL